MVIRAWRGYASAAAPEAYPKHLLESVRPKLERLAGFRGLSLLRRRTGEEIEYLVLPTGSRWTPCAPSPVTNPSAPWSSPRRGPRWCGSTTK